MSNIKKKHIMTIFNITIKKQEQILGGALPLIRAMVFILVI